MKQFGLIGKSLDHSFSKAYFEEKFVREGLDYRYDNFPLSDIAEAPQLLSAAKDWGGLNVTIPYKTSILEYVTEQAPEVKAIGACNVLKPTEQGWIAHNTDYLACKQVLAQNLATHHQRALILGTGGAAKAVAHALSELGTTYFMVSREPEADQVSYEEAGALLGDFKVLINATPVGTWPELKDRPPLDLSALGSDHLVFDLIYNPAKTELLKLAGSQGALIINGKGMLELQAELAWHLWIGK